VRDRAVLVVFGAALVVVPLYVLITDEKAADYDALRAFVLVQAGIVFCLMSYTILWVLNGMWKARKEHRTKRDSDAGMVVIGSVARNVGVLVLLVRGAVGTIDRIGNTHLDWRTPTYQLALLLLFYGWALIDRRVYRTTKTPQELVGGIIVLEDVVEQAKQVAEEAGVLESAEAFKDAHELRRIKDEENGA
jgi:hypothetical protein